MCPQKVPDALEAVLDKGSMHGCPPWLTLLAQCAQLPEIPLSSQRPLELYDLFKQC